MKLPLTFWARSNVFRMAFCRPSGGFSRPSPPFHLNPGLEQLYYRFSKVKERILFYLHLWLVRLRTIASTGLCWWGMPIRSVCTLKTSIHLWITEDLAHLSTNNLTYFKLTTCLNSLLNDRYIIREHRRHALCLGNLFIITFSTGLNQHWHSVSICHNMMTISSFVR